MKLFGRKSCYEKRDWEVRLFTVDSDEGVKLTEQLNEKEAKQFYNEAKKELSSSSKWFEVESSNGDDYDPDTRYFNKDNITHIKLQRN
jgi:hypothetical protein